MSSKLIGLPFCPIAATVGWDRATYADFVGLTSTIQTEYTFPGVPGSGVPSRLLEQAQVRYVGWVAAAPLR